MTATTQNSILSKLAYDLDAAQRRLAAVEHQLGTTCLPAVVEALGERVHKLEQRDRSDLGQVLDVVKRDLDERLHRVEALLPAALEAPPVELSEAERALPDEQRRQAVDVTEWQNALREIVRERGFVAALDGCATEHAHLWRAVRELQNRTECQRVDLGDLRADLDDNGGAA